MNPQTTLTIKDFPTIGDPRQAVCYRLLPLLFLFLFTFSWSPLIQAQEIRYQSSRYSLSQKPALKSKRGQWGMYFWEFGDGHYQIIEGKSEQVSYIYHRAPRGPVKVYLTPYYTKLDLPVKLEARPDNIQVDSRRKPPVYAFGDTLVHIETNAGSDNLLVPGHPLRVAVHYKNPRTLGAETAGYLLVFLNPKTTRGYTIKYPAFKYLGQEGLYYDERFLGSNYSAIQSAMPLAALSKLTDLRLSYQNLYIFETTPLAPGEERRLFFSLQSDTRLRSQEALDRSMEFKAVWIPKSERFDERLQIDTYVMRIDSIHDPNRIRVRPDVVYFRRNPSQTISYTVDFQNIAEGIVQDLEIRVPIPEGLKRSTAMVSSNKFKQCSTLADTATEQCFLVMPPQWEASALDLDRESDLLHIKIFNADIAGLEGRRRGLFNQHTKGRINFDIQGSGIKQKRSRTQAEIRFIGAEPIKTDPAILRWRYRGIYLRAGYAFDQNIPEAFAPADLSFPDQLTAGISYENTPLGSGWLHGIELSGAFFRFGRTTVREGSAILGPQSLLFLSEQSRMAALDATLKAGYQVSGLLRAYTVGGLSLPGMAFVELDARAGFDQRFVENIYSDLEEMPFGLLQGREEVVLLGEPFQSKSGLGWIVGGGVEIGKLEVFALGLRYTLRHLKIYDGSCQNFHEISAYLRLPVLGGF